MKKIKRIKSNTQLKLKQETIRVLTTTDLQHILGGKEAQGTDSESYCPTL